MKRLNDIEILSTTLPKSREANLKWLMQQYGESIYHLLFLTVKDHALAEDITQDVFIKAYCKLDTFRGEGEIKHWLFKIAMNESKKYFRSWTFRNIWTMVDERLGSNLDQHAKDSVEEEVENRLNREDTLEMIMSLLPMYRQVIILHYYEDLTTKEIARILSVSQDVVRTRLHRARKQLRKIMSKEDLQ
ncbi:sigma-70 family RNA polymerase sigma factor [Brevibacillus panacihumi]|uniref:sigma-70 family RNA polymerase sigma factor n=1 Tax=Brevibacillus panacihumi TaxID=497735 RepID=UPI001FE2B02C|nr:sigma-70 family RNA polymerase sigma factor [Brevibacillus panacihumi]